MPVDTPARPEAPKFEIISKAIEIVQPGDDGKRRFHLTASSTIEDRGGDEITKDALEKAAQAFRDGITIFMDHDYKRVGSAFGLSDSATVIQRGMDPRTHKPIFDLDVEGVVNTPNPRAVQLADTIDGGYAKLGASLTAFVRKHARKPNGGMLITEIEPLEASVVGIAENQRSWAHKAAVAIKSFGGQVPDFDSEDEDDPMPETETIEKALDPNIDPPVVTEQVEEPASTDAAPPEADAPAAAEDATEDGQDSTTADEPAGDTPETASATADPDEDAPTVEKSLSEVVDPAEVAELVQKAAQLVEQIGVLRKQVDDLTAENATLKGRAVVADEVDEATAVIKKVLDMPLRSRTAGYVEDFVAHSPVFAPEVQEYLTKRSKLT